MPRPASPQPTDVELQILNILWEIGPSTVREIHDRLRLFKDTNYSTTVKMLGVMLDKQLVRRNESIRPQVYQAATTRHRAQKKMLKGLIDKAYAGSVKSLILQALTTQPASQDDLAEIRELLDQIDGDKR